MDKRVAKLSATASNLLNPKTSSISANKPHRLPGTVSSSTLEPNEKPDITINGLRNPENDAEIHFRVHQYGYGYGFRGVTIYIAVAILLLTECRFEGLLNITMNSTCGHMTYRGLCRPLRRCN